MASTSVELAAAKTASVVSVNDMLMTYCYVILRPSYFRKQGKLAVANPISLHQRLNWACRASALVLAIAMPSLAHASAHAPLPNQVSEAAGMAQKRCYEFMHEDADEFVSCIDALNPLPHPANKREPQRDASKSGRELRLRRLGVHYFGWVGANNSARVALPGAEAAAMRYFRLYQRERRQLGIEEASLCQAVAGDCTTRLAQIGVQAGQRVPPTERK